MGILKSHCLKLYRSNIAKWMLGELLIYKNPTFTLIPITSSPVKVIPIFTPTPTHIIIQTNTVSPSPTLTLTPTKTTLPREFVLAKSLGYSDIPADIR
jgi:hypothetical protein